MMNNTILERRRAAHISQEELARRCGMSRQFLGLVEKGKSVPTVTFALRLARELNCEIVDLWPMIIWRREGN